MHESAPETDHAQQPITGKQDSAQQGLVSGDSAESTTDDIPGRPSWKTAPIRWWPESEDGTGLPRKMVEYWRKRMIGKRWVFAAGGTYALDSVAYRKREASKRLEKGQLEGSDSEIADARKELDELDEIERKELSSPPEWDFNESELPDDLEWAIDGTVADEVRRERLMIIIGDTGGSRSDGIIINVGRG